VEIRREHELEDVELVLVMAGTPGSHEFVIPFGDRSDRGDQKS
jgi:hypothetical protein